MEKKAPLLTIRPQFSPLMAGLESMAVSAVGTVGIALVGGTILLAAVRRSFSSATSARKLWAYNVGTLTPANSASS